VHEEQLSEHGGEGGVRDQSLFESALHRPQNLAAYGEHDVAALAASYGYGLARNHPFIDGNNRTAFVAVELFVTLNGWHLEADDADCVIKMLELAAGNLSEQAFAAWVRQHVRASG
jgi:death-on-curing protein